MNEPENTNHQPPQAPQEPPRPQKANALKANIQLAIVLAFIIGGFFIATTLKVDKKPTRNVNQTKNLLVETSLIAPSNQKISFSRTGTVEVNGQINIVPQVSGRIVYVHPAFNDGGVFKKGETLFKIEQADFINQINVAKAQVEQARTNYTLQQAESQSSIDEWKSLNPDRPAPDLVAKRPQLEQALANLNSAKAQLSNAQLELKRTKFNYNFDGRIIATSIELGQFVQTGQSYGTAYPKGALEVTVPVEDRLLKYMSVTTKEEEGSSVTIHADYRGEKIKLDGIIDRISSTVDTTTRFADVIVQPSDDQWDILVPGVFVDVELTGKEIENVWNLPNAALQGQNKIWMVQDDNTLQSYQPTIITKNDTASFAVGNGQTVRVVHGLLKGANNGMKVTILQNGKKSEGIGDPPTISSDTPMSEIETQPAESPLP